MTKYVERSDEAGYGDLAALLARFDESLAPIADGLHQLMATIVHLERDSREHCDRRH